MVLNGIIDVYKRQAYDNAKIKVRNACNRLTKDKRDDCSRSLLNFLNMKNHYVNGYESKRRSLP